MTQRDHIQTLIEKYWQGETSLSEEQELKAYYESEKSQGSAEGAYFAYLKKEQSKSYTKTVKMPAARKSPWTRRLVSIAAALLVMMGSWWSISQLSQPEHTTIEDPELALQITREAFALINGKVDKGGQAIIEHLPQLEKTFVFKNL